MRVPDFLIVGAGKAGTTSLHHYVAEHPQVFMPRKGIHYFAYEGRPIQGGAYAPVRMPARTWDEYLALFRGAGDARAVGESSATYFGSDVAARRIHDRLPEAKIVIMLREPVARAHSEYVMWVRNRRETLPPPQAFRQDAAFVQGSFYYDKLRRYFDLFPRQQIWVGLYEDFRADPTGLTQHIYRFLGVDDDHRPDTSVRHNPGGLPRSRFVNRMYTSPLARHAARRLLPRRARDGLIQIRNRNLAPSPGLPPEVASWLRAQYRDDITATADLIGRDLSSWLSVSLPQDSS